jgi:hypothetical protein
MIVSRYRYKFVIFYDLYGVGIQTDSTLSDTKRSFPVGAFEVCHVGRSISASSKSVRVFSGIDINYRIPVRCICTLYFVYFCVRLQPPTCLQPVCPVSHSELFSVTEGTWVVVHGRQTFRLAR